MILPLMNGLRDDLTTGEVDSPGQIGAIMDWKCYIKTH